MVFKVLRRSLPALAGLLILGAMVSSAATGAAMSAPGQGLDLSAYKGKVVYLDFWASWCNPCRQSFPWMNDIQQTFGRDGLVVIAVNVDRDRGLAQDFLQDNGAGFKVLFDPDGKIASQYDFRDMPTSILIGRDGNVHYVHSGFYLNKEGLYLSHIRNLLNRKAS